MVALYRWAQLSQIRKGAPDSPDELGLPAIGSDHLVRESFHTCEGARMWLPLPWGSQATRVHIRKYQPDLIVILSTAAVAELTDK